MLDLQMERVYSQILFSEKFLIKLLHKKYKLFYDRFYLYFSSNFKQVALNKLH
jgi:hypothetical protein